MPAVTTQQLTDASTDCETIANIANSTAPTTTDRYGNTRQTTAGAVATIAAINSRGNWATATAYAIKDIVLQSGTWYICVVPHTSAASFSTDLASKWRVYQGVLTSDLAAYVSLSGGGAVTGDLKAAVPLPYTATNVNAYGDSITNGVGATTPATGGWLALLADRMGWVLNNEAISGGSIMDWIVNAYARAITSDSISVVLPGFNDQRYVGSDAAKQAAYKDALMAAVAYLAIPDTKRIKANGPSVSYTGTWATSPVRSYGKYTNNQNATATFPVSGSTVYISVIQQTGNGGVMNVTIDGVDYGDYDLQASVGNGGAVSSINYMPKLLRFGNLGEGKHTVVLKKVDATDAGGGHAINIDWVAGDAPAAGGQPRVYVGSTLRMNATGAAGGSPYNQYTEAVNRRFQAMAEDVCRTLAGDGLEVRFLRTSGAYDPDQSAQVNADNIHPSDTGHSNLYNVFFKAMANLGRLSAATMAIGAAKERNVRGFWTPKIFGGTLAGSNVYSIQEGEYATDGVMCTASFRVAISTVSGPTGLVLVSLPFAIDADSKTFIGSIGLRKGVTLSASTDGLYVEGIPGTATAVIRQGFTASESNLPWSGVASGAEIRGTITYPVTMP